MTLEQKRHVVTAIPGPNSVALQKRRSEVVSAGVGTMLPTFIEEGHGAILKDVDGNHLIDMALALALSPLVTPTRSSWPLFLSRSPN